MVAVVAGLLATSTVGGPSASATPPTAPRATSYDAPRPTRVLLIGDSVTQGSAGDWTWRYRLDEHLEEVGADVDLVGCRRSLYDLATGRSGSEEYVDRHFDRDHCARWGNTIASPEHRIARQVTRTRADVLVVELGVNDLRTGRLDVPALGQRLRGELERARARRPGLDVVIVPVAQAWVPRSGRLNAEFATIAADLDTAVQRVVVADVPRLQRRRDTWDGTHPTATGEVRYAVGVSAALAEIGVGEAMERPWPHPENGPREAPELSGFEGNGYVALSWGTAPGVDRVWLETRDRTAGGGWRRAAWPATTGPALAGPFAAGHVLQFRLQPARGRVRSADVRSNVVTIRMPS